MAKATMEQLDTLHDEIAAYYMKRLQANDRLAPGELNAINAFLKNNDITTTVVESSPVQNLLNNMKNLDIDSLTKVG